ncbi:pif1 [Symbiodinium microadriaticum]|nr:pif1 [Symbiodinium microadriaticum]
MPPVGLCNLGASCYLNASLQSMFAIPELDIALQQGGNDVADRLARVYTDWRTATEPFRPTPLTDIYYRNRQEDAHFFLLQLLDEVKQHDGIQHVAQTLMGVECPRLRCQHCGWQRDAVRINFTCLQLELPSENAPFTTVEKLLQNHLSHITLLEQGLDSFQCPHGECTRAGRHKEMSWREVNNFHTLAGEKTYLLFYTKILPEHAIVLDSPEIRPRPRAAMPIDLDPSDSDSDVLMQKDDPEPKTLSQELSDMVDALPSDNNLGDQGKPAANQYKRAASRDIRSAKRLRGIYSYTKEERTLIGDTLRKSASLKDAMQALGEAIPKFTVKNTESSSYLNRTTLRGWFNDHDRLAKALALPDKIIPKSSSPEQPPGNDHNDVTETFASSDKGLADASSSRRPPSKSCRSVLSEDNAAIVATALEEVTTAEDLAKILAVRLPDFSCRDTRAANYIPRSTLYNWCHRHQVREWFSRDIAQLPTTWQEEHIRFFGVVAEKPQQRADMEPESSDVDVKWFTSGSWTFCPHCGRHQARTFTAEWSITDCKPEIRDLAIADIKVDYVTKRGGHAETPGIEIAVRPWLYPLASFADSDLQLRLHPLGWTSENAKPSVRAGFLRKILSRCTEYSRDYPLKALYYDLCMAHTISAVVNIGIKQKVAPEIIASDMDIFEGYWHQQIRKMEDICRLEHERTGRLDKALPNVFFTIAPAEWKYLLANGLFFADSLSHQQDLLTLHLYHSINNMLEAHLLRDGPSLKKVGVERVRQWSLRFEFQSRGTLHVHVVLWVNLAEGWSSDDLNGRTDTKKTSPFLELLERLFRCRADVQCGDGSHVLLRYVAGYISKASDALQFKCSQAAAHQDFSQWRQTYRLLSKKSPMEQELIMEFAGLSMVRHSFSGISLFAPIPGSKAKNSSRDMYASYQHHICTPPDAFGHGGGFNFIQWLRRFRPSDDPKNKHKLTARNAAGPARGKDCGVAISFPFELLDIFIGAWAASCLPGMLESRLLPEEPPSQEHYPPYLEEERQRKGLLRAPAGCLHLKTVLCLDEFQKAGANPSTFAPDVGKLLTSIELELQFRGLGTDRINTFKARVHACTLLLLQIYSGAEDPELWQADEAYIPPGRLRNYDLIILDEVSQIDSPVWRKLQTALAELHPSPYIVLVGDFQQLQPIVGQPRLHQNLQEQILQGAVTCVRLRQHEAARSTDPAMLDFLNRARQSQPTRAELESFFRGRLWSTDLEEVVRSARTLERDGKDFTFLTVTNRTSILVHPICVKGQMFLPVAYGWATTIRRAQGATLGRVGLWFDRRVADRGYAYVGVSRAKLKADVFHLGQIRRTDWRAVGGENDPGEQSLPSVLSDSTGSDERPDSESESEEESGPHSSDFEGWD